MTERKNVKLIAFVGLSGTGRSAATAYLGNQAIPKVSFAEIIQRELDAENLTPTVENERFVRENLRLSPSGDIVANEVIDQINGLMSGGQHKIAIDGLGSWDTYKRLRHEFSGNMIVIALVARRHIRHRRMAERQPVPLTASQTDQRDYDMIETMNKGGVIAMADYFITDNGSVEQLYTQIDKLLEEIEF